ncbi:dihydrofolate reductase [Lederbergia lenta]|uniref:dihydrofolate reductase n=1 Tax=Lederbergia lenta TaxID=1467 RepID=UPI00204143F2|nr:dihydrofolate reductase [Lederbergia lenta]MCM3109859.1 dihydrofolate reductase [Lederbergia lenta]
MSIKIIACFDKSNSLGYGNKLLYSLPNDLKRFKELTSGHFVLFGRKTFESVLTYNNGMSLPNRENVILTRNQDYAVPPGTHVFHDIDKIIEHYTSTGEQDRDLWIAGGGRIYEQLLPYAEELYLTKVHTIASKADTFFPVINLDEWRLLDKEEHIVDEKHEYDYSYHTYRRIRLEKSKLSIK